MDAFRKPLSDITNLQSPLTEKRNKLVFKLGVQDYNDDTLESSILGTDPDHNSFDFSRDFSSEIEELNQRNDQIVLELERERAKNKTLTLKEHRLQETINQLQEKSHNDSGEEKDNHIRTLSERVSQLNIKLKTEEQQRQRVESLLKSKDSTNLKLKERNDRLTKMVSGEEKSNKKIQEQLKKKESKSEKLSQDYTKEHTLRLQSEKKSSELQEQVEMLTSQLMSFHEESTTNSKLLQLMEDKLRHANQSKDSITQRLQQEEKSRMEESLELCSLREEVSRLCESVLVEKQKSQELEGHIDELQSTNIELSGQNKSLLDKERQANEEIASLKHELEDQLEFVKDFEQKIQHSNEREQLLRSQHTETIENLDNQIKEFELLLEQKRDQVSSLEKNLDQTQTKLKEQIQYHEQDQAELTKVQQTCSTLELQVKELQDNKQVLSKKLEKETKEKQALTENLKELSNDIPKLIESQQQLEEKLKQTEKELELTNQKYLLATDDTQRERTKWERTWKELEETVKLNQQLQTEKRELESSQKYSSEMSQLKYMNKVTMLEKKCDYLKRMNTLDAKHAVTETQNQLFDLMAEHEKLTSVFQDLESILVEKEKQVEQFSQKLLQVDDLLTQQHKQSVEQQPNKTVKNNLVLEKCIDEILLECTITGVIPSKLNAREKTTLVVEKIHDYAKELTNAIIERDQYKTKLDSITRDLSTTHDIQFRCVEKMIGDVRLQLGDKLEFNSLLTNIEQQLKLVQMKMNMKPTTSELEVQTDEDERLLELQEKYERAKATCIQLKDVVRKFTVMQQENLKPPSPIQKVVSPVRSIPSPVQSTASTPPSAGKKDTSYKGIHKKPVSKNKPK